MVRVGLVFLGVFHHKRLTVGAVSNRTGPDPNGNVRHEISSVAALSMNGLAFARPSLRGNYQFGTLKLRARHYKTLYLIPMGNAIVNPPDREC